MYKVEMFLVSETQAEPFWPGVGPCTGGYRDVAGEVRQLFAGMDGAMKRGNLRYVLGLKHEGRFRKVCLRPAVDAGFVVMTKPDTPRSFAA